MKTRKELRAFVLQHQHSITKLCFGSMISNIWSQMYIYHILLISISHMKKIIYIKWEGQKKKTENFLKREMIKTIDI